MGGGREKGRKRRAPKEDERKIKRSAELFGLRSSHRYFGPRSPTCTQTPPLSALPGQPLAAGGCFTLNSCRGKHTHRPVFWRMAVPNAFSILFLRHPSLFRECSSVWPACSPPNLRSQYLFLCLQWIPRKERDFFNNKTRGKSQGKAEPPGSLPKEVRCKLWSPSPDMCISCQVPSQTPLGFRELSFHSFHCSKIGPHHHCVRCHVSDFTRGNPAT